MPWVQIPVCPLSRAAVMRIHKVCGPCAVHSACSVAASYMLSMHVTRVQLSACALCSHARILDTGGSRFVARHRMVQWSYIRFRMRMVMGSIPHVRSRAAKRRMVRWSGIRFTCGRSWVRIPVCPVAWRSAAWFGGRTPAANAEGLGSNPSVPSPLANLATTSG